LSNRTLALISQIFHRHKTAPPGRHMPARAVSLAVLVPTLFVLVLMGGANPKNLRNRGFESSTPGEFWQVDKSEEKQAFSISLDRTDVKEGQQSLLITAMAMFRLTKLAPDHGLGSKLKSEIRDSVIPRRTKRNGSRRASCSGFRHPAE
jgi:hypothetical protein